MPPAPQPRPKKSGNGCLIALAIVGGLAVLLVVLVGAAVWRFSGTKEGKAILFGAIGEATRVAAEAQSAPGAAEVRALGCEQAMVLDVERMSKIFEQLDASAPRKDEFSVMVVCQVGILTQSAPTCDDVARTYRTAVGAPPGPFVTNVKHQGRSTEACSTLYGADGKKVRDLAAGSTPRLPGGR